MSSPSIARFDAAAPLRAQSAAWRAKGERVVLVPTMGALHEGHLSLIAHAGTLGDRVIVSIFVNPTQFGPEEDFSQYPRDMEADLALLSEAGVDAAYAPSPEEMHPSGFSTSVTVRTIGDGLCGAFRPGHFTGVATVVAKLINQAQADAAVFGEKDFQQLQVVRRMARDLDMPVTIHGAPIARAADGLALSSRNRYLDQTERKVAPRLRETLQIVADEARGGGATREPLSRGAASLEAAGFSQVQYLSICDAETLEPVERVTRPARILGAAYLGRTRLIDNLRIDPA